VRRLGDSVFRITADDERVAAYCERLFAGFAAGDDGAEPHRFHVASAPDGTARLLVDGEPGGVGVSASGITSELVHTLSRLLILECDALGLHAGGVARDGVGVALPAAMESGKSTLTAALVRAGFAYLSDEAVLLDWDSGVAIPFPKPISLDPGSWALFPDLEPHADLPDDDYKARQWHVPPDEVRSGAVAAGPVPIRYYVFPKYAKGATTELTPLPRAEAVVELAKNTFRFNEQPRRCLDALAAAARGADCYRLAVGDLERAVALVRDLVERDR
jgi:hypothetical protein